MNTIETYRWMHGFSVALAFLVTTFPQIVRADEPAAVTWTFEGDQEGQAPVGFVFGRTGQGREGEWLVQRVAEAPSGHHVLAQRDADATDYRFPIAVANEPLLRDIRVSVKCQPVSGTVDQACGLVLRYQNENNYYLTRANALENNVRFYKLVNGKRQQLGSWDGVVATGAWHALQVEALGDHFTVFWNGQRVIDANDRTFSQAGRIGLWTKADSVTDFDDLKVEPLAP